MVGASVNPAVTYTRIHPSVWARRRAERQGRTVLAVHAVILQDVQDTGHLTEDKNATALLLHTLEELVEDDHLAGVVDQVFTGGVRRSGFLSRSTKSAWCLCRPYHRTYCAVEQVRMASNFAELRNKRGQTRRWCRWECDEADLHDDVHQSILVLLLARKTIDSFDILLQHRAVPFLLHLRQADVDVDFLL